jgi:hypothetical protein
MEIFVGIALPLVVCSAAAWIAMDRDRVFYPTVLIVIAAVCVGCLLTIRTVCGAQGGGMAPSAS